MHTKAGVNSECRLVCLALSALYVVAISPSIAAEVGEIGQELPVGTQSQRPGAQGTIQAFPEWQSATVIGLSGKRIADSLSKTSSDHGAVLTRGLKEAALYRKVAPSVVYVLTSNGSGSGSYIGSNLILTNWHVVKGAQELGVLYKPSREGGKLNPASVVRGTVTKTDAVRDLALVRVAFVPASTRPLNFAAAEEIEVGADVHAIGHPEGEVWTYTRGVISQIRRDYEWKAAEGDLHRATVIQTQTPINVGNSGGPLIGDSGNLLGVNSFKRPGTEGMNYAVAVDDIRKFLKSPNQSRPKVSADRVCEPVKLYEGRDQNDTGVLIQFDTNCDAKSDASVFIPDDKSKPGKALLDSNFDGNVDIVVEDRGRDGKWDISFHDVDFDGLIDLVGYHPDGKLGASRFEKYAAR